MTPAGLAPGDPTSPTDPRAQAVPVDPKDSDEALVGHPDPGPLLAAGTFADVFAVDEARVLRRYRDDVDATREADLVRHVVSHGFPAPAVLAAAASDIVMERLHGPTLLQSLAADETSIHDAAELLADLHVRLHAVPAPAGSDAGDAVLHLELHPGNIILTEQRGPVLAGWSSALVGPAALDVATTALMIAEVAVDAGGVYSQAARALLAAFLGGTDVDPLPALDDAAERRAQDPALVAGERALVPSAAELVRELRQIARPH
ncbi:phosphotransferase [Cellulomonas sp. JH27-2]|uniref:phosphotransferase n=1 Tax=Cellulomonas sp. JH27-2 TaxID=2774139 RepID=UPI00177F4C4E|nr:phosphotransferase [Cellulomonas sp. JH27-2]MBD8057861.1 phosphotransferase [Cellulomonas sp. JH27-2]